MRIVHRLLLILTCLFSGVAKLDAQNYVFFLHNKFVEISGPAGTHDEYGPMEYNAIVQSFRQQGFVVFSELRPLDADVMQYARKTANKIDSLLKLGTAPRNITIIGTSKGGYIAQRVSSIMKHPELNFVFVGSCLDGAYDVSGINFCGNILSIYEQSDEYGQSCTKTRQLSTLTIPHYKEISLHTGIRHGFLYKALPAWITPASRWARGDYELQNDQGKNITDRLDSLLDAASMRPFNGIMMIRQNDATIYTRCMGYSDLDQKTPIRLDNQFVVGSISKQFTAVMVLQEYEKGRLKLDVPIRFYLPQLADKWADSVTVHQLLTHTHGIRAFGQALAFRPGTQYEYSQIGFELMARILEHTSKKTFAELSADLFKSCKMSHSTHPGLKHYPNLVSGYTGDGTGKMKKDSASLENYVAAGAFISSINDLVLWNEALHGGKLLLEPTYKLMVTEKEKAIRQHQLFGPTTYGYGITVSRLDSLVQLGQTGFAPGFVSMDFYFPETKTSLVILQNTVAPDGNLREIFACQMKVLGILREELLSKH